MSRIIPRIIIKAERKKNYLSGIDKMDSRLIYQFNMQGFEP